MTASESFEVEWSPTALRSLERLPEKIAISALEYLYGPLAASPYRVGKALHFELEGLYSAHRGDYRILYEIDREKQRIRIQAIAHRSDVYRRRQ